jgi:hypothetical protein
MYFYSFILSHNIKTNGRMQPLNYNIGKSTNTSMAGKKTDQLDRHHLRAESTKHHCRGHMSHAEYSRTILIAATMRKDAKLIR